MRLFICPCVKKEAEQRESYTDLCHAAAGNEVRCRLMAFRTSRGRSQSDQPTSCFQWGTVACLSLLGLLLPARAFGMPQVCAVSLLVWRDLGGCITGWNGIATHRIFESGR